MIIDKSQLRLGIWYEDKDGKRIEWDGSRLDPPPNAVEEHVCFPLEIRETVYKIDHNGNRIREFFAGCTHIGNGDILVAMANSGDFTLAEAIALYANCCERCANVLAYKYLGPEHGYPEHSEEWEKCNTACRHCVENYDEVMKEAWLDDMKKAEIEVMGVDLSEDAKAEEHKYETADDMTLALAMSSSGDYSLEEAIELCSKCCERCLRALAYKYLGHEYGYAEYSEEWKKCDARCTNCVTVNDLHKITDEDLNKKSATGHAYKISNEDLSEKEWDLKKAIEDPGYKMFKEIKETCF